MKKVRLVSRSKPEKGGVLLGCWWHFHEPVKKRLLIHMALYWEIVITDIVMCYNHTYAVVIIVTSML